MLDKSYSLANDTNISGNQRIFLIDASAIPPFATTENDDGVITNITSKANWSVIENLEDLDWSAPITNSDNGVIANVEVSFGINKVTQRRQLLIQKLHDETSYTAIVHNSNDTYFLLGHRHPLTAVSSTTQITDKNGYTVKMTGRQKTVVRQVSPDFISTLLLNQYDTEDSSTGSLGTGSGNTGSTTPGTTTGGTTGSPGSSSSFNGVYYPANNFQLTTETFVLAQSGTTILLPLVPVNGQTIIVKDSGNGATANVIIKSPNALIDGATQDVIDNDRGSFMIQFAKGAWYNIAYTG